MYNPYQHAAQLGLTVLWKKLSGTLMGYYDHSERTIWVDEDLNFRQAKCTIAHEIVHAEFSDTEEQMGHEIFGPKMELRCDKIAAKRLIFTPQLVDAMREYDDPRIWCAELCVMPWALDHFLEDLTPQERIYLEKATGRTLPTLTLQEREDEAVALDDAGHLHLVDEANPSPIEE